MSASCGRRIFVDLVCQCYCSPIDTIAAPLSQQLLRKLNTNCLPYNIACLFKNSSISSGASKILRNRVSSKCVDTRFFYTLSQGRKSLVAVDSENARSAPPTLERPLDQYTTSEIHDLALNIGLGKSESFHRIYEIIEYLITVRKEKLSPLHYAALIRANASAFWGSAETVRDLLREMDELGIVKDDQVYHCSLLALAVHPDYLLRMEILCDMKKLWLELSSDGWHHLIIGFIRDRQYEMAMDKLENMLEIKLIVKPWLFDILMYQLCESEEYEEAFSMLKYRWDHYRSEIRSEIWYFMMESLGKGLHLEGLNFIWRFQVRLGYLIPSDGMLSAVLNTAARHGDSQLATAAAKTISTRSTLEPHHYEALIEAYVKSNNLKSAFRILCVMEKAGFKPDAHNTRPLFSYLFSDPRIPSKAWDLLTEIYSDGHSITITAINVILEACVSQLNITLAIVLFKKIHTICDGPNTATINHILQGLSKTLIPSKREAMFLASEMNSLKIKPDELTYDRLILVCIREKDYADAFRYLEEMIREGEGKNEGKGWWLRKGTAERWVQTTIVEGDPRGWDLIAQMSQRGMDVTRLREWAKHNWKCK